MIQPHTLTYPDVEGEAYSKARYHYLLQIVFGETIAIDYCRIMATFAPTPEARRFLLQQQNEEEDHLELLTDYVGSHPRPHAHVSWWLKKLDTIMAEAIERKDYVASIFIQNFIIEGLNISLLRELEHHTDSVLSELSTRILRDEIGHMEFGVNEVKRMLEEDGSYIFRRNLIRLQRKTLFYAIGLSLELAREAKDLGIPMKEFSRKTVEEHIDRISRAGLPLPFFDRVYFQGVALFLRFL